MNRYESDKIIKKALLNDLFMMGDSILKDIVEWLWEDYGIRVRTKKEDITKKIVYERDISSRELALFMLNKGVKINEELWFAELRKNVHDDKKAKGKRV